VVGLETDVLEARGWRLPPEARGRVGTCLGRGAGDWGLETAVRSRIWSLEPHSMGPISSPDSTKKASPYVLRSSSALSMSSWVWPRVMFTRRRSSPCFTDG